jgi:Ni/Fe-hydrogenase b-type cytochrome subunit
VERRTAPASALARVPGAELVRTYVWEKPVRIAHWLIFFSLMVLAATGLYLHRPFLAPGNGSSFLMARVRFTHELAGFVLISAFLLRAYWFFKGNFWARWSAYIPIHRWQWNGMGSMLEYYLFLRFRPIHRVGHNPLAALSYFVIYLAIFAEILIGLALFNHVLPNPVLQLFIGWLPRLVELQYLRLIHYLLTFVFLAFAILHVYICVLVSLEEENGLLDSIFSGWKFVPAAELRHEIITIPEARRYVRRHRLVPATLPERTLPPPRTIHAGPGPVALFRNWISYVGAGIAAVGVLVFGVLTAYHTIGGGSLTQPYGDLVIFFAPPLFVILGVTLILIGMYAQWIRWRMHKPLDFARFPKWDLNVARERKALLAVALGAAVLAVPGLYGSYAAYRYTDAVSFCGAVCHSMTPEYVTYGLSPHARVACAQCHVAGGATGYIQSKVRGMQELVETIQNTYSRPIPVPVVALRPIRGNCEKCHWPANFFGSHEERRVHFLSDEQNTRWDIDMSIFVGGGTAGHPSRTGIHWHVASKVEYIATDPARQNIPWVRAVNPVTGVGTIYTLQGQKETAQPPGELRTMDCVDCHNRPSHIFQSADESVDTGLVEGRIDPSLPFIRKQGVAALASKYGSQAEAMSGIDRAVRTYYQTSYPQVYAQKQPEIREAIRYLQEAFRHYEFPEMRVRWDTYPSDAGHFHFLGCYRCHDGQHQSADGSVIRSDCNACHKILQQGKAGNLQFAATPEGLTFQHPVDIGGAETQTACSSCHTGGPM